MPRPRKLTDSDKAVIRRKWHDRPTLKSLANDYGVSVATISKAIHVEITSKPVVGISEEEFDRLVNTGW